MTDKHFGIWYETAGGSAGSRAAWLKINGRIAKFATQADAEAEALKRRKARAVQKAVLFRYTVRELRP